MPRAFLALTLPPACRETLFGCRDAFVAADPAWAREKWVRVENLHVTMRFLGTLPDESIGSVAAAVGEGIAGLPAFVLRLGRIRAVPGSRSASGLWAVPSAGVGEATDLAAAIAEALAPFDIEAETHRFRPHVTLCRARRPRRVAAHAIEEAEHILVRAGDDATSVSVHGVTLFSSTLTPRGPVYEELSAMPLRSD